MTLFCEVQVCLALPVAWLPAIEHASRGLWPILLFCVWCQACMSAVVVQA